MAQIQPQYLTRLSQVPILTPGFSCSRNLLHGFTRIRTRDPSIPKPTRYHYTTGVVQCDECGNSCTFFNSYKYYRFDFLIDPTNFNTWNFVLGYYDVFLWHLSSVSVAMPCPQMVIAGYSRAAIGRAVVWGAFSVFNPQIWLEDRIGLCWIELNWKSHG